MIIVRAKASPFEVMFMVAAMLGGIVILLFRQRLGNAATNTLPDAVTLVFGAGLVICSATVLMGLALRTLWGSLLERSGLGALGILMLVYSALTLDYYGMRASITALFFISFAVASAWRVKQISADVKETEAVMTEASRTDDPEV